MRNLGSINMVKSARNILDANKTALVVITAANITEIDGTVTDYENVKDEPVEAKVITKAAGTDLLPPLFLAADSSIKNILDLVESYIGTTQPAFTNELKLTAELQVAGARHTSGNFSVLNDVDGTPLLNAIVEDNESLKTYKPGADHQIVIGTHHPGSYSFTISCTGFQSVVMALQLSRGVINSFTIRLKKNQ